MVSQTNNKTICTKVDPLFECDLPTTIITCYAYIENSILRARITISPKIAQFWPFGYSFYSIFHPTGAGMVEEVKYSVWYEYGMI